MLSILAAPILFLLPGLMLMRVLTRERGTGFFLLSFLFSIPLTSIVAFALAQFGFFSLLSLTIALIVVCVAFAFLPGGGDLSLRFLDPKFSIVLILLAVAAFCYYRPPFEYYFGGRDPGIYVINGIRIARTGAFLSEDPLLNKIPEAAKPLFFEKRNPIRYMGFSMKQSGGSQIIPNFFYLYPVWIAIFYALLGIHGAIYATPFLACAVLIVVGIGGRLLVGRWEAIGAVFLLGCSTPLLWFARFPNSELLASVLLFIGIVCFELLMNREDRASRIRAGEVRARLDQTHFGLGAIGALSLALAFWARVDALLMAAPFVLYMVARWIRGGFRKADWWIGGLYFLFLGLGFLHARFADPMYVQAAFLNLKFKPVKVVLVTGVMGLLIAAVAVVGRRWRLLDRKGVAYGFSGALLCLLLYAVFVRPYYPISNIGSPNAEAFLAIGWYFTYPVVLLATAGMVLYAARIRSVNWIFLGGAFVYGFLYFYRIRGHAEHFWMLRRYLMIIFPAVALLSVYALRPLALLAFRKHARLVPAGILACSVLLGLFFVWRDRPLHRHQEFAGSFQFIESIAKKMSSQDLLLIGSREANDLHIVGPLLSYYFDRNVLVFLTSSPDLKKLDELIAGWKGRVLFLGAGNTNLASNDFSLQPLEQIHFETPVFDETYHQRPTLVLSKYFQIGFYRLTPGASPGNYFVDVGGADDASITNFFLKEQYSRANYRWTDGEGHVFFPSTPRRIKSIVLQMNPGPWVPGMERMHVKLLLNGRSVVDLVLRNGYNSYEVSVPEGIQEAVRGEPIDLLIESKSWMPKRVLDLPDTRRIGVIVDWVKLNLE